LNVRFEERLAERTRIAQELHDTLLQGVLSASMQLHVANDQIDTEAPSKPLVMRVLELMGELLKMAKRGARACGIERGTQDLDQAFSRIREKLAVHTTADFSVIVEGPPRSLRPAIRDEVYWIGGSGGGMHSVTRVRRP